MPSDPIIRLKAAREGRYSIERELGEGGMVGIGPSAGDFTQAGGYDERVHVDDYIRAIEICPKIIVDWSN